MEKRVLTVLRSGGEYGPQHVRAMQRQLAQWAPDVKLVCLSDVLVEHVDCIPLKHDWPGWWAKLELFRPDIEGGFLYTDLDNVIVGPIDEFFRGRYTTQRHGWNALMYVPDTSFELAFAYERFEQEPERFREKFFTAPYAVPFGDAGFVNQYAHGDAWEDVLPGKVVNIVELIPRSPFDRTNITVDTYPYKKVPDTARVVLCANKRRRPWKLKLFEHLYADSGR